MMNGFNPIDDTSTYTLPFIRVGRTSEGEKTTGPSLLTDTKKTVTNDSSKYSPAFNGAALTPNELAILWNKFQKHGHFRVEDDSMTQVEIPSAATSFPSYSELNNNFMNRDQHSSHQCDIKSNDISLENNSLVVNINREEQVPDESSSQFMADYSQHKFNNQNTLFQTPNLSNFNDQSEFIINDDQCSFIDISNNKYQWDTENIQNAQLFGINI